MIQTNDKIRIFIACGIALGMSLRGYKKKSLSQSGAIAACIVGFLAFSISYTHGCILLVFYITSSHITKIREDKKMKLEYNYQIGGQRSYIQVLASSFLASCVILLHILITKSGNESSDSTSELCFHSLSLFHHFDNKNIVSSYLWTMYITHYACANGDTWASELGIIG
jgi:uncharacterized membrane protein